MKADNQTKFQAGQSIVYNDGRMGHQSAIACVLSVVHDSMTVQFEDRADTTTIKFSDSAWMDFIQLTPRQTMCEFFARDDVKAQKAIQKRNPYGSEEHKAAYLVICQLAKEIGASEFCQPKDY